MPQSQKRLAVAGALALALSAGAAWAQENALATLPSIVVQQLRPGAAIEQVIAQALAPIRQHDLDGNGLDSADIATAESVEAANRRAQRVSTALRYDLDGNGQVTELEARRSLEFQQGRQMQQGIDLEQRRTMMERQLGQILAFDLDRDGSISMSEMLAAEDKGNQSREALYDSLRRLLLADPNGDGRVTPAELETIVRAAFAQLDGNGNGVIDMPEYTAYRAELQEITAMTKATGCKLPKAGPDEEVTLVGMYDGNYQPTVTVTGQDNVTSLARVIIEPGNAPLYVVLSSYVGMIWKFEGETARLKHVAVLGGLVSGAGNNSGGWAGSGVLGVAKDRVSFVPAEACGRYYETSTAEGKAMVRAVSQAAGAGKVNPIYVYAAKGIMVPSGKVFEKDKDKDIVITGSDAYMMSEGETPKRLEGGLSSTAQEDWLAKAGGVVTLDPKELVAEGKVEAYEVLPGQDGLRQLILQGILERTGKGYRVIKPLRRWPAGLTGSHAVTFILPKGIPMPQGSLGHSILITE
ncbi:EF-hand domain-containing protein [Dongia sp. agr-C8]